MFKELFWNVICTNIMYLVVWCCLMYFMFYCLEKFMILNWLFTL